MDYEYVYLNIYTSCWVSDTVVVSNGLGYVGPCAKTSMYSNLHKCSGMYMYRINI